MQNCFGVALPLDRTTVFWAKKTCSDVPWVARISPYMHSNFSIIDQ